MIKLLTARWRRKIFDFFLNWVFLTKNLIFEFYLFLLLFKYVVHMIGHKDFIIIIDNIRFNFIVFSIH